MRVVSLKEDLSLIHTYIDRVLDKSKALPDKVFRGAFKFFLFITFDELFMGLFYNHIRQYLMEIGENEYWLVAIDSKPKQNFESDFEIIAAIQFLTNDSEDDYLLAVNGFTDDNPASVQMHSSDSIIALSSCGKWAVFGNRGADIGICAFAEREYMKLFRSSYNLDLLGGVKPAAEYAYGAVDKNSLIDKFCNAYRTD